MYFGHPYYPYRISIHHEEKRNPENMEQIITKHMSIAEEIQRRIASINERFGQIEKMIQERMRRNPETARLEINPRKDAAAHGSRQEDSL
jgi:hypothetical protein